MAVYKRSVFLINPKFQYKFSLLLVFFALVATAVYPFIIHELFEKMINLAPAQGGELETARTELLRTLFIMELVILGLIFIFSIFITHKVAGPMHKLKNHLRNIRNGGEIRSVFFRKGDYFHDVAEEINQTLEYFDRQRDEDFETLNEVSSYMTNLSLVIPEDKKPVLNEIQSKLAEIRRRNKVL